MMQSNVCREKSFGYLVYFFFGITMIIPNHFIYFFCLFFYCSYKHGLFININRVSDTDTKITFIGGVCS